MRFSPFALKTDDDVSMTGLCTVGDVSDDVSKMTWWDDVSMMTSSHTEVTWQYGKSDDVAGHMADDSTVQW